MDAAFSPDGQKIVSGGVDGTVRLWTPEGRPLGAPFEGHEGPIWGVAFHPDGDRIVSGGVDGKVFEWREGISSRRPVLSCGGLAIGVAAVENDRWSIYCGGRLRFLGEDYRALGMVFLAPEPSGVAAIVPDRGVYATTDALFREVRAFGEDGTLLTHVGAVPAIGAVQVRQFLLGQYTLQEHLMETLAAAWTAARGFYEALGWFRMPFLVFLTWVHLPDRPPWGLSGRECAGSPLSQ